MLCHGNQLLGGEARLCPRSPATRDLLVLKFNASSETATNLQIPRCLAQGWPQNSKRSHLDGCAEGSMMSNVPEDSSELRIQLI